jgi:hypothetical protein
MSHFGRFFIDFDIPIMRNENKLEHAVKISKRKVKKMGVSLSNAKSNMTERNLYELLGVKLFRKAVMAFERARHKKDGGVNTNYHLKSCSLSAAYNYKWYLVYNSVFHVISILLTAAYFAITRVFGEVYLAADILVCIIILFNIYCLMLQRYTWLRLAERIWRLEKRRAQRIAKSTARYEENMSNRAESDLSAEYGLILKIKGAAESGEELVISADDIGALSGIAAVTYSSEKNRSTPGTSFVEAGNFESFLSEMPERTYVTGKVERRVSSLQKFFGVPWKQNVLFSFSVLTKDAESERLYRDIFHISDRDGAEEILESLLLAYNKKITRGGGGK